MKRFLLTAAIAAAMLAPAIAQSNKMGDVVNNRGVVAQGASPKTNSGMTVGDCLIVLSGLNRMDELERAKPFEFAKGSLRLDLSRNIAALTAVQNQVQPVQQKIFNQVLKTVPPQSDGKPAVGFNQGTDAALEYDRLLREVTDQPCTANVVRISAADLNLEKNQLPIGVLSAIDRILDR